MKHSSSSDEQRIIDMALELMARLGGSSLKGWSFRIGQTISAVALCRWDISQIQFSRHFIARMSREKIREAIVHEIAHAIVGNVDIEHGPEWKEQMRIFGYPDALRFIEVDSIPPYRYGLFGEDDELIKGFYRMPRQKTMKCLPHCVELREIS